MRNDSFAVLLSLALATASCGRIGFDAAQALDANNEQMPDAQVPDAQVPDAQVPDADPVIMLPTEGLTTRYALDGDPNDAIDGADGLALGGIQYEAGCVGQAAVFDGVDDVIQLPALTNDDFTVTLWVKTTAVAPGDLNDLWFSGLGIVDAEVCGNPDGGDWGVALLAGGHVATGAGKTDVQINDGVWHALAFTRRRATDAYAIYVDGVLEETTAGPNSGITYTDIPWIGLGNNPCDASRDELWFQGSIDEVRFYDRLLTPEEIVMLSGSCQ